MRAITDFHSHILPGVDDGSQSVEESLEMLRRSAEQGIRKMIATPHFYARHDTPEQFLQRRANAWDALRQELEKWENLPAVELGAEVHYFAGISSSEVLSALTSGGDGYLLLEMPPAPWTETMYREIEGIYTNQGITPVIAHVDRYISPFRTYGIPKRLAQLPVLVQANASFFLRPAVSRMALRMLKANQIHLLGSDCHNLNSRSPNLGSAISVIEKHLGSTAIDRICDYEKQIFDPDGTGF